MFLSGTNRHETRPAGQTCVPAHTSRVRDVRGVRPAGTQERRHGSPAALRLRPGPTMEKGFYAPGSGAAASASAHRVRPGGETHSRRSTQGTCGCGPGMDTTKGFWKNIGSTAHSIPSGAVSSLKVREILCPWCPAQGNACPRKRSRGGWLGPRYAPPVSCPWGNVYTAF